MPKYHPDASYLNDYASGSLPLGLAIVVKAHLEFCPECRNHVQQLEQLGAVLFETSNIEAEQASADIPSSMLNNIFAEVALPEPKVEVAPVSAKSANPELPKVVQKLVKGPLESLSWRKLSKKLRYSRLRSGDKQVEVGLYDIKAGAQIPNHTHRSDEVTLVLKGSFSDLDGIYREGDFIVRTVGEYHKPIASQDENCLCLSAQEKPISFTGLMRIFNPLLKTQPA
jgi:putative transcriptional regulator